MKETVSAKKLTMLDHVALAMLGLGFVGLFCGSLLHLILGHPGPNGLISYPWCAIIMQSGALAAIAAVVPGTAIMIRDR